jgi:hypothetical protein
MPRARDGEAKGLAAGHEARKAMRGLLQPGSRRRRRSGVLRR